MSKGVQFGAAYLQLGGVLLDLCVQVGVVEGQGQRIGHFVDDFKRFRVKVARLGCSQVERAEQPILD
jgi:metal-responsive CopG/Arc/MetJ family transcriptional regulator